MVYHYSDGSLEYEEHFNATGTLQEVLKYFYDANGNVEYLLYKNDNFSTASAYDLYYYVRNATGDITDLFQVRAKSGTSTTVVNRLAAHYEYDPYGNILSINKYNNDPIGDINPIRYKDYYYDLQTGWYQLGSRFYDAETGRFLNADDVSLITETDSGVVDKNLYAYCDGNPVMRKDDGGEFWNIVIGAGIGVAFEVAQQMIVEGKSLSSLDKSRIAKAAIGGAISGGFGAANVAVRLAVDFGVNLVTSISNGNGSIKDASTWKKAAVDSVVATGLDYVCGKGGVKIIEKVSSKIKTSVPQKHYVQKPLTKWQKRFNKGFSRFFSKLNYFVYSGASYNNNKNNHH